MISPKGAAQPEAAGSSLDAGAAIGDAQEEEEQSPGFQAVEIRPSAKHSSTKAGTRSPIKSPMKRTLDRQAHGNPDEEYEYYSEEEYGEEDAHGAG